ncbi:LacI family DNA-binding transcriptional regulator [Poriferisphaera sp. WC338]|uniref:LacI family DNA-binding transcriptional regulator n=1 Tax=Poriferisphaera sp. WC338 TaxID=3425129 RepID=UPI003D8187CC
MSLLQVAELAGVSPATVSKVVNNYPSVSKANIDRVREAMRQLQYQPSARKRSSSSKISKLPVAVLIVHTDMFHHYASTCSLMMSGVEEALRDRDLDLIVAHVAKAKDLPLAVSNRQISGLVLIGHDPSSDVIGKIEGIPTVWLTSHHDVKGDMMLAGNESVGRLAAEYLIDRRHNNLAVLNILPSNPAIKLRIDYFNFVASSANCQVKTYLSNQTKMQRLHNGLDLYLLENLVSEVVDQYLAEPGCATGLFVPHDMIVAMVYRVLEKRGIKPNDQLEIIGCDDEKAALIGLYPRPATIHIGAKLMGQRAVEQLFWRIGNRVEQQRVRVMVEPELVPGD